MGWPPGTFPAHTPWRPEDDYVRRTILHHQFSLVRTLIPPLFLFQPPQPLSSPLYSTLGHVTFRFGLLVICDPSSIKAALFLYYTSVLISTKNIIIFSLWDFLPYPTEGSYEIEGLRLSAGRTHKLKPSPSAWPDSWNVHIPLRSNSYVPDPHWTPVQIGS